MMLRIACITLLILLAACQAQPPAQAPSDRRLVLQLSEAAAAVPGARSVAELSARTGIELRYLDGDQGRLRVVLLPAADDAQLQRALDRLRADSSVDTVNADPRRHPY